MTLRRALTRSISIVLVYQRIVIGYICFRVVSQQIKPPIQLLTSHSGRELSMPKIASEDWWGRDCCWSYGCCCSRHSNKGLSSWRINTWSILAVCLIIEIPLRSRCNISLSWDVKSILSESSIVGSSCVHIIPTPSRVRKVEEMPTSFRLIKTYLPHRPPWS